MATKREKEKIIQSFENAMNYCKWYEGQESKTISLAIEIGVLKGLMYAMDSIGISLDDNTQFLHFNNIQLELKDKENNIY